jgi:hypothetical protein
MKDIVDRIMAYEDGTLSNTDIVVLFQELADTGMAWKLQGSYGRTANAMIRAGLIHPAKDST